jgi:hypothetical protein
VVTGDVAIHVPAHIYEQVKRAARAAHRPVDDVLAEALLAVVPSAGEPDQVRATLAQMAYLNDAALWQAARSTMPAEQRERLASLHDKQQRRGLSDSERSDEAALLDLYHQTVLVRAQAAVLLKQRGYDIADPTQFAPLT